MRVAKLLLFVIPLLIACAPVQPEAPAPTANESTNNGNSALSGGINTENAQQSPTPEVSTPGASESAEAQTPQSALERLFNEPLQAEAWFAPAFLNAVPEAQISELLAQLTGQLGTLQQVEGEANSYTLIFELGTVPATIELDADGRINTLFFESPTLFVADVDEAVAMISELPGELSLLATKNGEEITSLNAETPIGVGSAYKLAVLLILREQIESGLHTWDEVVSLLPEWKAPPASLIRNWPDNSPITLHSLATLMISISDNTAADALLHIVGREEVEAIAPHSVPLLTTQELFKLKAPENSTLLEAYRRGDEAAKRDILQTLATLPPPQSVSTTPILDIEWFFTAYELCDLMAQVQDLPLMTVQPGPASTQPERWSHIAFKGGSEVGVLNLTTWLVSQSGDSYCITMTQNDPDAPIDEEQFVSLYRSLVAVLE